MLCVGWLALAPAAAGAETYRVVGGPLDDEQAGTSGAFSGKLEISLFEPEGPRLQPSLLIDDFQLQAGDQSFRPREPIEFQGRRSLLVQIADQIQFDGDDVDFFFLRSGGGLVAVDESEVTFRFMDFRSEGANAGRLTGHLGDSLLPRRVSLVGSVREVDQHLLLPRGDCPILPPQPGDGGGVIVGGGDDIVIGGDGGGLVVTGGGGLTSGDGSAPQILNFESFDIQARESVAFEAPVGGAVLTRVTGGGGSTIEGTLEGGGVAVLLAPSGIVFTPTLEELGITAPSGAEVTFDDTGSLTVRTEGDLLVAGGVIDVPGLTSFTLIALGSVNIEGTLELPPGVTLRIEASEIVVAGGISNPGGDVVINPLPPVVGIPFCDNLLPVFPADAREIGSFSLVMSAARQVEINVDPRGYGPRMGWGRHGIVSVVIRGSADFDIRDVDERSLRLGPGEAEPTSRRGRSRTRRVDVDRDGEMDLVVRFDAGETGIAPDDTQVCLFGQTTDSAWIEGCDAIDARAERQIERGPSVGLIPPSAPI
jgi:filamentous hemagglutinin family protein